MEVSANCMNKTRLHNRLQIIPVFVLPIALSLFAFLIVNTADNKSFGQITVSWTIWSIFMLLFIFRFCRLKKVYFDESFIYIKPVIGGQTKKIELKRVSDFFSAFPFFSVNGGNLYKIKYRKDNGTEKTINIYPTISFRKKELFNKITP